MFIHGTKPSLSPVFAKKATQETTRVLIIQLSLLVPMTGLEPARHLTRAPKARVSTIPPHRHISLYNGPNATIKASVFFTQCATISRILPATQ